MSKAPKGRNRALLALDFEPASDGFLFYRNLRSSGTPVTAGEREEYLAIPLMDGDTRALWRGKIAPRTEVGPPRSRTRVRLRRFALLSNVQLIGFPLLTLVMAVNALGAGPLAVKLGFGALALLGVALSLFMIVAKVLKRLGHLGPFNP